MRTPPRRRSHRHTAPDAMALLGDDAVGQAGLADRAAPAQCDGLLLERAPDRRRQPLGRKEELKVAVPAGSPIPPGRGVQPVVRGEGHGAYPATWRCG